MAKGEGIESGLSPQNVSVMLYKNRIRLPISKRTWFYTLLLVLSLSLHVFNTSGVGEIKLFHIAAAIASVITLLFARKTKTFLFLVCFTVSVGISAVLSPAAGTIKGLVNLLIVVFCCFGVSTVRINDLLRFSLVLIPIDLLSLLFVAFSSSFYRFQGFYNDPNYLCTTLLVFFYVSIISFYRIKSILARTVSVINMVIILLLIIMTLSRTGLLCAIIMLFALLFRLIKRHFLKLAVATVLVFSVAQHYASEFFLNEYALLYERVFDADYNVETAGKHRSDLSLQNLRFIAHHPQYLFFGLGPGTTDGEVAKGIPGLDRYRVDSIRDHNTLTSCLSEYGIIALFFFVLVFIRVFKSMRRQRNRPYFHISIAFYFTLVLSSLSIWQMTYLPFWWGVFLLNNKKL